MTKHVKPNKEELEKDLQDIIIEAEKLKDEPVVEETPEDTPEVVEEKPIKIIQPAPEDETPEPPEKEEEPVELEKEPVEDVKKELKEKEEKLSASARENQKIYAKNRVLNQALIEAEDAPEPTEEELTKEYPDWEVMSDTERKLAKDNETSKRWMGKVREAQNQAKKIEKWNESVDKFADDPVTLNENPELEGKIDAFREFAKQESSNSVPFNILVGAFLHEKSKEVFPNKGKMFETGTGGPNDKGQQKSGKISIEEGRKLRENNYDKWKEYVKAGKIESDF